MPSAFYLPNQSSQKLRSCEIVELAARPSVHHLFPTKDLLRVFNKAESTDHCFYSLVEPRDPNLRINVKTNPVAWFHGLVADFDAKISNAMLAEAVKQFSADFPPAYTTKTYSGGARIIWLFERPVGVIGTDLAKELLKKLAKDMKLTSYLPGFDEGAWMDPCKPFELGADWVAVNPEARIPRNLATKLLFDVGSKVDWAKQGGPQIPIEDVAAEVERRWPGRWQGPFAVGSQGVRFWEEKADNPNGCWIRETGVVAFSGENRFMHWDEILGKEFVAKYEADRIGGAIADAYFDGKCYWSKDGAGRWHDNQTEVLRRKLRSRGLAAEGRKGAMSEVDKALSHIEDNARVDGAFPFLFNDREVVDEGARKYLNISRIKALPPSDGTHEWGQEFAWIAAHLKNMFPGEQLDAFLSWHRHFWINAWMSRKTKGHALFIAGDVNAGKTLTAWRIVGASVGGFQDVTTFLLGKTEFNAPLFESPLGTVDDAVATADRRSHDVYSQIVKKLVANPSLTYRRMYANPVTMPYYGRLIVTLNNDPVSIGMLPSADGSILDKMVFLLASSAATPIPANVETIIAQELPHYLAFLRDYKVPAFLQGDARFGMLAYKNEQMVADARANSSSTEFSELLDMWKAEYFKSVDAKVMKWQGTSSELMVDLQNTETLKELTRSTVRTTTQLGRYLSQLSTVPSSGVTLGPRSAKGRIFIVART